MSFSAEKLGQLFDLRRGGVLVWIAPSKYHKNVAGNIAGTPIPNKSGKQYWHVSINGRKYKRSHLVYCMTTGRWPQEQIDHIDGNSLNDDPSNLREATHMQNMWNLKRRKRRLALPMGVKLLASGRYQARIRVNNKCLALGSFETSEMASAVYQSARKQHFGEFA